MAEYILQYGKYGVCTTKRQITIDISEKPIEYYLDQFYPVGTYYTTMDETFDPNVSFVGTWVRDTDGLVTVAAEDAADIGMTGGEETHTLTTAEMPSHTHTSSYVGVSSWSDASYGNTMRTSTWNGWYGLGKTGTSYAYSRCLGTLTMQADTGVSTGHNNVQKTIISIRWHRVS